MFFFLGKWNLNYNFFIKETNIKLSLNHVFLLEIPFLNLITKAHLYILYLRHKAKGLLPETKAVSLRCQLALKDAWMVLWLRMPTQLCEFWKLALFQALFWITFKNRKKSILILLKSINFVWCSWNTKVWSSNIHDLVKLVPSKSHLEILEIQGVSKNIYESNACCRT